MLVGFLTFFIDIENFTDRAMVAVTTMLVIATNLTGIQAVSRHAVFRLICEMIFAILCYFKDWKILSVWCVTKLKTGFFWTQIRGFAEN